MTVDVHLFICDYTAMSVDDAQPDFLGHSGRVRRNSCLFPVSHNETDTDAVDVVVVIEHALAVAIKVLNVSANPLQERKAPFKLYGTTVRA
jgi:hypothetical protein